MSLLEPLVQMSITALVAVFSLAWFVVGIFVGRRVRENPAPSRAQKRTKRANSRKDDVVEIYVGNLSYDMSEKELRKLFAKHGEVCSSRIIKNRMNGKSKGFGFVEMPVRREATAAVKALNGADIKGRRMVANEAKSRSRD